MGGGGVFRVQLALPYIALFMYALERVHCKIAQHKFSRQD
jgi:hypothetical protein